jgi:hypothetical protein
MASFHAPVANHKSLFRMEYDLEAVEEEDSPYPEVRASVSNIGTIPSH